MIVKDLSNSFNPYPKQTKIEIKNVVEKNNKKKRKIKKENK